MGTACSCLSAQGDDAVSRDEGRARPLPGSGPAAAAAGGATAVTPRPSLGWYSAGEGGEGWETGSEADDEWHDAMSEPGDAELAEALAEWEAAGQWTDPTVDRAIQVLKAHGHLLPPALEALAQEQRSVDREASRLLRLSDGAAQVAVQAAAGPKPLTELQRTRSQQLRGSLREPGARALLAEAADLAANGRALAAHARLETLVQRVGGCSMQDLAAVPPEAIAALLPPGADAGLVERVVQGQAAVQHALQELQDDQGWMVSRDDDLQVRYRHGRGSTHSLKFSAVFGHPLEHLLALAYEFDLLPTWNKFSLAAAKLVNVSMFESLVYGAQWIMRPFKHMQGLLHCRGYDLADEHRCLLITIDDCAPEALPPGATLPAEWPKRKLVNFLKGSCLKLRPLPAAPDGSPRTEGSLLVHIDPHIPFLPAFLLNFVLGVLAPYIYNQMRGVLDASFASPTSPYAARIAANPQLYGLVRTRLEQYAAELQPVAGQATTAKVTPRRGSRRGRAAAAAATPSP